MKPRNIFSLLAALLFALSTLSAMACKGRVSPVDPWSSNQREAAESVEDQRQCPDMGRGAHEDRCTP